MPRNEYHNSPENLRRMNTISYRIWNSKRTSVVVFSIGFAMMVVGGVMIGLAISTECHLEKPSCDCPLIKECAAPPTIETIFHFRTNLHISWKEQYRDLEKEETLQILNETMNKIGELFESNLENEFIYLGSNIQLFLSSTEVTTVAYGLLFFAEKPERSHLKRVFTEAGFELELFHSVKESCSIMLAQPTVVPETIKGFTCDPTWDQRTVIVMVDLAQPSDPTITEDEKLQQIKWFLSSILPNTEKWFDFEMGLGFFYGTNAYLANNRLCKSQDCWKEAIELTKVNGTAQSHNVTRVLEFIRDEFSNPEMRLKYGRARTVIILTDGFEFDYGFGQSRSSKLIKELEENFYIGTVAVSQSKEVRKVFRSLVREAFQLQEIDYWYQLPMVKVDQLARDWICEATPVTPSPVTRATPRASPKTITNTPAMETISPRISPFCQEPADIILIIQIPHCQFQKRYEEMIDFTITSFFQAFEGMNYGNFEKLTRLGIISYEGSDVIVERQLSTKNDQEGARNVLKTLDVSSGEDQEATLSEAFYQAVSQLQRFGRKYASWTVVAMVHYLNDSDFSAALNTKQFIEDIGAYVIGVGSSEDQQLFNDGNKVFDRLMMVSSEEINLPSKVKAVETANTLQATVCENSPVQDQITVLPGPELPKRPSFEGCHLNFNSWPNIGILIDTSSNHLNPSNLLNDQGFETMRLFLLNNLRCFQIDKDKSKVALVTFDERPKILFHFNTHSTQEQLYDALTINWQFEFPDRHHSARFIEPAVNVLVNDIFNATNGFQIDKPNFLWIFTTGTDTNKSEENYRNQLRQLSQRNIEILVIGLGNAENSFIQSLTTGPYCMMAPNYTHPIYGLDSELNMIGPSLLKYASLAYTPPTMARLRADIIIAIDLLMGDDILKATIAYLQNFISTFSISETDSRFVIFTFDDTGIIDYFNFVVGQDYPQIVNNLRSTKCTQRAQQEASDYFTALDFILNVLSSKENGKRLSATSMIIFAIGNNTETIHIDGFPYAKLEKIRQSYHTHVLCMCCQRIPSFVVELDTNTSNSYVIDCDADGWCNGGKERTPMQAFFDNIRYEALADYESGDSLTLLDVQADILILLDYAFLSESSFENIKEYIRAFKNKFDIDLSDAQFGLIGYSTQIDFEIALNNCYDESCFNEKFKSWKLMDGFDDGFLVNVFDYLLENALTTTSGWRTTRTYILIFSSQIEVTWSSCESYVDKVTELRRRNVFLNYVTMETTRLPENFTLLFDAFQQVDSPMSLIENSTIDETLVQTLIKDFKEFKYPPRIDLSYVISDFVFLVDVSIAGIFEQIKPLLLYMAQSLTISPQKCRLALILYSDKVIFEESFDFLDNKTELLDRIQNLQSPSSAKRSNIVAALDYLMSFLWQELQTLTYVTIFQTNPNLKTPLDNANAMIDYLRSNSKASLYGFDLSQLSPNPDPLENSVTNEILKQIIPEDQAFTHLQQPTDIKPTVAAVQDPWGYLSYIVAEYSAYQKSQLKPNAVKLATICPTASTSESPTTEVEVTASASLASSSKKMEMTSKSTSLFTTESLTETKEMESTTRQSTPKTTETETESTTGSEITITGLTTETWETITLLTTIETTETKPTITESTTTETKPTKAESTITETIMRSSTEKLTSLETTETSDTSATTTSKSTTVSTTIENINELSTGTEPLSTTSPLATSTGFECTESTTIESTTTPPDSGSSTTTGNIENTTKLPTSHSKPCNIATTEKPKPDLSLCTQNAQADIMLMIDGTFSMSEKISDTISNFYANISTSRMIVNASVYCNDKTLWKSWKTRVTGMVYYKDTYKGPLPNFCLNQFSTLVRTVESINSISTVSNAIYMSNIVKKSSILMESLCTCRRFDLTSTSTRSNLPQLMIWIPNKKEYDDPPLAFFNHTELFTFQHYYLPYNFKVSESTAHRMWKEMKEIELPKTPNHDRKELVKALWKTLCNVTKAPGILPEPPDDWISTMLN